MATGLRTIEPEEFTELDRLRPVATRVERVLCRGRLRDGRPVLVEIHDDSRAAGVEHGLDLEVFDAVERSDDPPASVARVLDGGLLADGAFAIIFDDPDTAPLHIDSEADLARVVPATAEAMVWLDRHRIATPRAAPGWVRRTGDGHVTVFDSGIAPNGQSATISPDRFAADQPFLAPELVDATGSGAIDLSTSEPTEPPTMVYSLAATILDACDPDVRPIAESTLGCALDADPDRRPALGSLVDPTDPAAPSAPPTRPAAALSAPVSEPREGRERLGTMLLFLGMVLVAAAVGWWLSTRDDEGATVATTVPSAAASPAPSTTAPAASDTSPALPTTAAPTTAAPPTTAAVSTTAAPTTTTAPAPPPADLVVGYRMVTVTGEIAAVGVVVEPSPPLDQPALPAPSGSTAPVVGGFQLGDDTWIVRADGAVDLVSALAPAVALDGLELVEGQTVVEVAGTSAGAWALLDDGSVATLGTAAQIDGAAPAPPGQVLVDLVPIDTGGVHVVDSGGGVQTLGSDVDIVGVNLADGARRIVSAARPPGSVADLWLIDDQGTILSLGDAAPLPSLPDLLDGPLQAPIVDSLPSSDGTGIWLIGADGGVFALGTAEFLGRVSAVDQPIAAVISPD